MEKSARMANRPSNSDQKPSLAELIAAQNPAQLQRLTDTIALANIEAQGLLTDILGHSDMVLPGPGNDIAASTKAFAALGSSLASMFASASVSVSRCNCAGF